MFEPLNESHPTSDFDSGEPELDRFLRLHALKNDRNDIGRTFVLTNQEKTQVLGFYTLSMAALSAASVQSVTAIRLPRYELPAARIGRLAVARAAQGQGLGRKLMGDALERIVAVSEQLGCLGVIVDAKHERAAAFYRRYGFVELEPRHWPQAMYVSLVTVRGAFAHHA